MSPSERAQRWTLAMRRGDFEAAWRETDALEANRGRDGRQAHHLLWDGSRSDGRRVMVRCHHGLGDTLQFSRFLPDLNRRASELRVVVPPPLLRLMRAQDGIGIVDTEFPDESDVEIEIMELAYQARVSASTVPPPTLRAPGPRFDLAGSENLKVAIFWSASGWGGGRYIPLPVFAPLAEVRGVSFFSFQQGPRETEAERSPLDIRRLSDATVDIADLARALCEMDLVISVDTMAAHLAGSLGRPVWLLLDPACDWRWMENRDDSPWYPGMRLFRNRGEKWEHLLGSVRSQLESHGR